MLIQPRTFKELVLNNLRDITSWRGYAVPIGVFLVVLINYPNEYGLKIIWFALTWPKAWFWFLVAFVVDAFFRAAYWYARDRDPDFVRQRSELKQRREDRAKRLQEKSTWPKQVGADEQQTCDDFIANLCLVKQFQTVKEELVNRWGTGLAPAMLFGGFGKVLVNDWETLSGSDRSYVCDLIEKAIGNGGEQLKSMTRLGLLKSMGEMLAIDSAHQREITAAIGEESRAYLESFIKDAAS